MACLVREGYSEPILIGFLASQFGLSTALSMLGIDALLIAMMARRVLTFIYFDR